MHGVRWACPLFVIAPLMVVACAEHSPTAPSGSSVTAVSITASNALTVGATVTLAAMATESDGSTKNVTTSASWQSSNPAVATVSSSGEATGIAPGTSTISASYQGTTGHLTVQVGPTPIPTAPVATRGDGTAVTGSAVLNQTLTADPGGWSGTQPITFSYQWLRCDVNGSFCTTAGAGATAQTYVLGAADVGRTIRVSVTASNSVGSTNSTSPPTPVVANPTGPPVTLSPPVIFGQLASGQMLAAVPGVWNGSTPMSFSYRWQRCGTDGNGCATVAGANTSSFVLGGADVGRTIRVTVTASNSEGSATATSQPTGLVE